MPPELNKEGQAVTLPVGPKTTPVLQMTQWVLRPLEFMEDCDRQFGDAFTLRLGEKSRPIVFFSHPAAIQQIFAAPPKNFDSGRANQLPLRPLLGKKSLEMLDGRKHQRQRQLLLPPFHGERMRNYAHTIWDTAEQVTNHWIPAQRFKARSALQEVSFRLMHRVLFGTDQGEWFEQVSQLFDELFRIASSSPLSSMHLFFPSIRLDLGAWSPWGRFVRQREQLDQLLYEKIQQRQQQPEIVHTDMLSLLMSATDENGNAMSDEYLHSELMTLLFAGHETIATATSWALYWIHAIPGVRNKILQELDGLGESPDLIEITKLPYLSAVVQESLRIYPVGLITFPRILKTPMEIGGYALERGTVVAGCIYLTHQRPDLYPEPKQFRPERFLKRQFAPHEFFPFGGGSRRCLGGNFAPYAMKLVLARILLRWDLALTEKNPVKPMRRGVTTAPVTGVRMVVKGPRLYSEPMQPPAMASLLS